MSTITKPDKSASKRVRLSRADRLRQLLDVSWQIVQDEGTDALTLPRLAEGANVAKPVVYDHFGGRNGLLIELYRDFDARQTAIMDPALNASEPTLEGTARVFAAAYIDCVLAQGREIPGLLAALAGSPELEAFKREYQLTFIDKCQAVLVPFIGHQGVSKPSFWALLGAADLLSQAAVTGEVTAAQAQSELYEIIVALVGRSHR